MSLKTKYPCDMHCHTARSDGNDTPYELIVNAAEKGMSGIGLVDHDICPPSTVILNDGSERDITEFAAENNLKLILGYEFSCDTLVDDVHICGYGCDWNAPEIVAEVRNAELSKSDAYRDLCGLLTKKGMPVDWEKDILNYTKPDGSAAIRSPEEVQRKHIFETIANLGYTETWSDAKLLVKDDPELNIKRKKIDPVHAIDIIHKTGGIAILAHPHLIDDKIDYPDRPATRTDYIDKLIEAGLDGIEASYTYDKTSYKGMKTPEEIEKEIRKTYASRVTFISGGSDYHADHKKGSKKVRELGERGLTEEEFMKIHKATASL